MNRKSLLDDKRVFWGIISVILLVGILVRAYKFGILMDAVQSDEMGTGYDAWCLLNYGTDRYGNSYPVHMMNFVNGNSALMAYLCAVSMKVFGFGRFALRFPALINSIVLAVFGVLAIKRCCRQDRKFIMLVYSFLWMVAPYTFFVSKIALDCNLMSGCAAVFLYAMIRAFQTDKMADYCIAGIAAGVLLYSYAVSYIVMPITLVLAFVYMIYFKKIRPANAIVFVIPLAILATPLILVQYINMFDKEQFNIGIFTIIKLREYRGEEVGLNGFFKWICSGMKAVLIADDIEYNSDPRFFNFYPMSIPFFVYGLFLTGRNFAKSVRTKKAKEDDKEKITGEAFIIM